MTKFKRFVASLLPVMLLLTFLSGIASAVLLDVGPTALPSPPGNGVPLWYRDTNRVPLAPCLSNAVLPPTNGGVGGPACVLLADPGFNPASAIVFPTNYPSEAFYFVADNDFRPGGAAIRIRYRAALESAFSTGFVAPGAQITFARIRIFADLPTAGTYVFTHPYGVETIVVDPANVGTRAIAFTRDIGLVGFGEALQGDLGPWLVQTGFPLTVGAETFLGDPGQVATFTGSPFGTNFFRVQGPAGSNLDGLGGTTVQTNLMSIAGKIYAPAIPTPLTADIATYTRDATQAQVDVFATSQPIANVVNSLALYPANFALTGVPSALQITDATATVPVTAMTTNNPADGKYFATASLASPATMPPTVRITNTADVPPTVLTVPLVDAVSITESSYNPTTKTLKILASSGDVLSPPTLQVFIPGEPLPIGTMTGGLFTQIFPLTIGAKTYNFPPETVTVKSSAGGSDTNTVEAVLPPPPVPVPVAPISISPTGPSILSNAPFLFSAVSGATSYKIYYENLSGVGTFIDVTPAQAGCVSGTGVCSFTPATPFTASTTFGWLVSALNAAGQGPWSATLSFVTAPATPAAPTAISPTGPGIATNAPFTFSAVAGATGYIIYSENLSGVGGFVSVSASQAGCPTGTGTCSYTPATPFTAATTFGWLVAAQNLSVQGPFSATLNFTTQ